MKFRALHDFIQYLESIGELKRITRPVDPYLEITELATRAIREQKPAILLENVKGSNFPLAINVYASERRIELALGKHPAQIGDELFSVAEQLMPPTPRKIWNQRSFILRFLKSRSRIVNKGKSQSIIQLPPDITSLPLQVCWPGDGGRFITQGQIFTYDPITNIRNVGMYRLQVYDEKTTGMHWQIQKGGGFHYKRAEQLQRPLEVAVALGTAPALLFATVAALPEGIDEVLFASYLMGESIKLTRAKSISILVPADAEFIVEGIVHPYERRIEGPFGDHFGHYSLAAPFPVFHITAITHRSHPVYPATVVGIPPMEDKYLGDATQEMLSPLSKLLFHEVKSLWAYYQAGYHNLLVAAVDVRYKKEALKTAFGLLGMGQLSLTKCLILVSKDVDPKNWKRILREIKLNFEPSTDFVLIPNVPLDTLDFTSRTMEVGSKMIIDATKKGNEVHTFFSSVSDEELKTLREINNQILDVKNYEDTLLVVKVKGKGRDVLQAILQHKAAESFKIVATVSDDIDIQNEENTIWGIFTRFDCALDIEFSKQQFVGTLPIYNGVLGIDATWKEGYPEPLKMDESIIKKVDEYWDSLWK